LTRRLLPRRALWDALAGAVVLALFGLAIAGLYTHAPGYKRFSSGASSYVRYEKARVMAIDKESLHRDTTSGLELGYQVATLRILTGEHAGNVLTVKNALSYSSNVKAAAGSDVIICVDTADKDTYEVWIYSYNRGPFLYLYVGLFVAALCTIGGGRGFRSVLGIIFTFTGIAFLFIPMLYRGYSPSLAAVGVVVITLCVSLVLLGGFSAKTLSAILGSLAGVVISILFVTVALQITHLTGFSTSEADALVQIAGATQMKAGELLFAAILISSLGAIMDVAISIASAVNEVSLNNGGLATRALFNSGMNVGRDMMGTMANTLIIAFTGTSLNVLVLLYSMNVTYYQLINNNMIGVYIVQAVSGSIAVVLTVPLVSLASAYLIPGVRQRSQESVLPGSAS